MQKNEKNALNSLPKSSTQNSDHFAKLRKEQRDSGYRRLSPSISEKESQMQAINVSAKKVITSADSSKKQ